MLIKWLLWVLARVKSIVLASVRDKYIKKEQFAFLKEVKCPNTANDIEKSAHNYYCMECPWLQIVIFAYFCSGDDLSILSTVLPFLCCGDKGIFMALYCLDPKEVIVSQECHCQSTASSSSSVLWSKVGRSPQVPLL